MKAYAKYLVIGTLAVALAGCGDDDDSSSGSNISAEEAAQATECTQVAISSTTQGTLINRCTYPTTTLLYGQRNVYVHLNVGQTKTVEATNTGSYKTCRKPWSPTLDAPYCFK